MKKIAYRYKNMPIPGGGYVTGFIFHPKKKNLLYIRTDIGGTYRFDYETKLWSSLTDSIGMPDQSEAYPIALALDPDKPERLLIASGIHARYVGEEFQPKGRLSISDDYGKTYIHKTMPCFVHGNLNGRGAGYRMLLDPLNPNGIYFASQRDGLWYSPDLGDTWRLFDTGGEYCMSCLWVSPDGNTLVTGTAGVNTGTPEMRGHSLYVSYDRGDHFEKLMMPENKVMEKAKWDGYVAHRMDYDGKYLYVTLNCTAQTAYTTMLGYSCDCGGVVGGKIIRYLFDGQGKITGYEDITPTCLYGKEGPYEGSKDVPYSFGFGGICSSPMVPGLLAASTLSKKEDGDMMFISRDYGSTWEPALYEFEVGNMHFETSYMKPEYNGGNNIIHWLSDIKINPFDPDEVWFNTGTGVYRSTRFTHDDRSFCDCTKGVEETVHLNVYSPLEGPVQAIDIVGDLGGFAFTDLDKDCPNSFADAEGNRYITCINADFADNAPNLLLVTARGNWKGKTKGGLILSKDYGLTFDRLPFTYGISDYLDSRFHNIEEPNVNPGWAAISSDGEAIVYSAAEGIDLYMKGAVVSVNQGKRFEKVRIFDQDGKDISDSDLHFKVFSDRVNPEVFYGFGDNFALYASTDQGRSFYPMEMEGLPAGRCQFGLIDTVNKTEIRGESGKEGVFYMAVGKFGLYKLYFDAAAGKGKAVRLTREGEAVFRAGLGLLRPEGDYKKEDKALYICGIIEGKYGFFRSFDDGRTWEELVDEKGRLFGGISSIDGDCRTFGRYFIATGTFGVKYGEPV